MLPPLRKTALSTLAPGPSVPRSLRDSSFANRRCAPISLTQNDKFAIRFQSAFRSLLMSCRLVESWFLYGSVRAVCGDGICAIHPEAQGPLAVVRNVSSSGNSGVPYRSNAHVLQSELSSPLWRLAHRTSRRSAKAASGPSRRKALRVLLRRGPAWSYHASSAAKDSSVDAGAGAFSAAFSPRFFLRQSSLCSDFA